MTHSSDYHIWQRNEFASNGVREFAEKGEAWTLMKEVEAAGERIQSVYGILSAPAVVGGTGQMNTEFEVFARHSYVSPSTPGFLPITRCCDAFLSLGQRAHLFIILQFIAYQDQG